MPTGMTTSPRHTSLVAWQRADDLFIRLHRLASKTFPTPGDEPRASHLDLLRAVAGTDLVARGYADVTAADAPAYLWHEFGDAMLLLP